MRWATASVVEGCTAERLHPSPGTAVLRRYRAGDDASACWLLAVAAGEEPRYCVLDDRALLAAGPPHGPRLAAYLHAATGGRIDLLAATTRTQGAAFPQAARQSLEGLAVAELWLPWTEDPADPAARRLRRDHAAGATTLRRAADRLDALGEAATTGGAPSAERLRQVAAALGSGEDTAGRKPEEVGSGADAGTPDGGTGVEADRGTRLAALAGRVRYRRAGDASDGTLPPGLCLRVLAPAGGDPRLAPPPAVDGAEHRSPAMAEPVPRFSPDASLFAAALTDPAGLPLAPEDRALQQLDRPFDRIYSLPYEAAAADPDLGPFFRAHYGFTEAAGEGPAWRRIDADWLGTAARLAFRLGAERDAAALVIALELGTPARSLVFPPSAQARHRQLRQLPLPVQADAPWTDHTLPLP
ncbi:MAG TPA: hypothetical protein VHQ65_16440 [Thermoanaerobaculia bacterium]|nr:hypothetical protein [Thermoanaerobaculia bacterium]